MALNKRDMATVIRRNGHLVLDGTESIDDLREALYNLSAHTMGKCRRIFLGTPIEILLPRTDVLVPKSTRTRRVTNADSVGGRL